jgi:hypothetical protein
MDIRVSPPPRRSEKRVDERGRAGRYQRERDQRADHDENDDTECTLPPGVIAHLYWLRWEIEKTFDELKSKLGETKAWASTANAKTIQAHFLCMAHNLMIRCEADLERVHAVRNEAELARRAQRLEKEHERLAKDNVKLPLLVRVFQRLTVRSVKFIRWLRVQLFARLHHGPDIAALRFLYATLWVDSWTPLPLMMSGHSAIVRTPSPLNEPKSGNGNHG